MSVNSITEREIASTARNSTEGEGRAALRDDLAKTMLTDLERREGQALFGLAIRLGLSPAEAQDAVQETLLRLWAQIAAGSTIESPRNWAYRTLYRIAMDEHRLRRRAVNLLDRIGRAARRERSSSIADLTDIWVEVDRLSGRQRQVIYLRYQADLAFDEIGAILGITASASRSHCTFALAALRKRIPTHEVPR
jgi:RNA polymerase sigma factor (sigma-70 family)